MALGSTLAGSVVGMEDRDRSTDCDRSSSLIALQLQRIASPLMQTFSFSYEHSYSV